MFLKLDNQFILKTLGTVELVLGHMSAPGRTRSPTRGREHAGHVKVSAIALSLVFTTEHLDKFG